MEAGRLDRRITIERASYSTDAYGAEIATWATHATVWAEVRPISDGERWRAGEVAAHVTTRFTIRWGAGVTVKDRIAYEGDVYEIVGVKEVGRRECQEITAAARGE